MPDKPSKKSYDILLEAGEIAAVEERRGGKQEIAQSYSEFAALIKRQLSDPLRFQMPAALPRYFASDIWRDVLLKTREFTKHEFVDDLSELRKEVDDQKLMIKHLTTTIEELSRKFEQRQSISQTTETLLDSLCKTYIEMISEIDIVKKLYIVETTNGLVCWTIVDTEPFDSTLLEPIYDAQVTIYKQMENTSALDFHVLNLSEFQYGQELESFLPLGAKLVWQR